MSVIVHSEISNVHFKNKRKLYSWVNHVITEHNATTGLINIILVTDDELKRINQKYLQRNYYTDIITFDYCDEMVSGDLYISLVRVIENADGMNLPKNEELKRVIIHGILHLLGYKDKKKEQKIIMRLAEDKALALIKDINIL